MTDVLILGGTAWLGRETARAALARGYSVTCLARGESGAPTPGATFVAGDRRRSDAYAEVADRDWDLVVDVSWQPGMVSGAVGALANRARHWVYVSSCSVYANHGTPGEDESAALAEPLDSDVAEDGYTYYDRAKVRCESVVADALGDRAILARSGLIGGPGDYSDRFGYWVSRFALAAGEDPSAPVLVPAVLDQASETLDVRDTATFLVDVAFHPDTPHGPMNVMGQPRRIGEVLEHSAAIAGFTGPMVPADPLWLTEHEVNPWSGPRSLPLCLPDTGHDGFATRDRSRAIALGLTQRRLEETLRDTLDDERARGLGRDRKAGMTRSDELALIASVR